VNAMISLRQIFQVRTLIAILSVALLGAAFASCGGSRAPSNAKASPTPAVPQAVDVTTAPTIVRDLPRYVEATGGLAGDEQTDGRKGWRN